MSAHLSFAHQMSAFDSKQTFHPLIFQGIGKFPPIRSQGLVGLFNVGSGRFFGFHKHFCRALAVIVGSHYHVLKALLLLMSKQPS
jgi:hypothetical protein